MERPDGPAVAAALRADPLADRFDIRPYREGGADVLGTLVGCAYFTSNGTVTIEKPNGVGAWHGWTRDEARELRDALDVLLRATRTSEEAE